MTTHDATGARLQNDATDLNFTPSHVATWSATSKRSLPPQVPLQRGPGSDLMRDHPSDHPRRRPFPALEEKLARSWNTTGSNMRPYR